ncbi:hypothetical protein BaRGS_00035044 [Batillaria attramentaria]|uniref:Uncharacterized protein n=1 Tax=Batillaria attramentaria TaxID=370345 RepID=A0ABD0JH42_9CAEN
MHQLFRKALSHNSALTATNTDTNTMAGRAEPIVVSTQQTLMRTDEKPDQSVTWGTQPVQYRLETATGSFSTMPVIKRINEGNWGCGPAKTTRAV